MPQRIHRPNASPHRRDESEATTVEIDGRELRLTNLDKVLWPAVGFTKSQLIDYYVRIAPVLLPHIADRPMTLARFPDGVDVDGWYQTSCWNHPPWMPTLQVVFPHGKADGRDYCLVNDLPSLVWIANLGTVELHPLLSAAPDVDAPHAVVFDLDPGAPAGLLDCAQVALWLRDALDALHLDAFVKLSGAKGMQVFVPLDPAAGSTYAQTKAFARALATITADAHADHVVAAMAKPLRAGKVFVDWSQNDRSKSTIAVYSLRSATIPTVSAPMRWEELEAAREEHDARQLIVDARQIFGRLERDGDLFAPLLRATQSLPE